MLWLSEFVDVIRSAESARPEAIAASQSTRSSLFDRIVLHEHREEAVVRDLEDRETPGRVLVRLRKRECELANRFGDAPLGNRH